MSFDEQPDGDPHGECAAEIHRLETEIERLTACLKTANLNHEHFEREWYLRGDEIERLLAEVEVARTALKRYVPSYSTGSAAAGSDVIATNDARFKGGVISEKCPKCGRHDPECLYQSACHYADTRSGEPNVVE